MNNNDNVISFLNSMNQVSTAIDALRGLEAPSFLSKADRGAFAAAKKDAYLSWFIEVLDEAALGAIDAVKVVFNLGVRDKTAFLSDTSNFSSAVSDFRTRLAAFNQVEAQLIEAEKQLKSGDKAKLDALINKMNQIEAAIQQLSDKIDASSFKIGADIVITYIKVGVELAAEEDPIVPAVEGICKVGEKVVNDIQMTQEIDTLNNELYVIWQSMAAEEQQVAALNLSLRQLSSAMAVQKVSGCLDTAESVWSTFRLALENENWDEVGDFLNRFSNIATVRNDKLFLT